MRLLAIRTDAILLIEPQQLEHQGKLVLANPIIPIIQQPILLTELANNIKHLVHLALGPVRASNALRMTDDGMPTGDGDAYEAELVALPYVRALGLEKLLLILLVARAVPDDVAVQERDNHRMCLVVADCKPVSYLIC